MSLRRRLPQVFVAIVAASCGDNHPTSLPSFSDLPSAPATIQNAARAVVRVRTAGEVATGSFISSTGLLLTNNHVLGIPVCPVEGCAVELTFMHQRGEATRWMPKDVFAVPVAVDAGLDMAVAQIFTARGGQSLDTPDFLALAPSDAAALLGSHVTIVGHPEGRLKKWTEGQVIDATGSWLTVGAYTLPGDSGSPILGDDGALVGLVHRGPTTEDLVTNVGVNVYTIGTASQALLAARQAPLPATMISTARVTTAADVVASNRVFLNAGAPTAVTADGPASVLALLGQACDTALARQDFVSPDDLSEALQPCDDAELWIECRADATKKAYTPVCPPATDDPAWKGRFEAMNQAWINLNGSPSLTSVSFGLAALSPSMDAGRTAGAAGLSAALDAAHPVLDFGVANYLAAFAIETYGGTDVLDYARGYRSVPGYEFEALSVASTLGWLASDHLVTRDDLIALFEQLFGDPRVNVGAKLYIEEALYTAGTFP